MPTKTTHDLHAATRDNLDEAFAALAHWTQVIQGYEARGLTPRQELRAHLAEVQAEIDAILTPTFLAVEAMMRQQESQAALPDIPEGA